MSQPNPIPAPPGIHAVFVDATGDRHTRVVCSVAPSAQEDGAWAAHVIETGSGMLREAATLPGFVGVLSAGQTLERDAPELVARAAKLAKAFGDDARLALEDLKETRSGTSTDDLKIRKLVDEIDT